MIEVKMTFASQAELLAFFAGRGDAPVTKNRQSAAVAPDEKVAAAAAAAPAAQAPAAQAPSAEASAPAITRDQLQKALANLVAKDRPRAVEALKTLGAAKLSEVKPEQFAQALALFTAEA